MLTVAHETCNARQKVKAFILKISQIGRFRDYYFIDKIKMKMDFINHYLKQSIHILNHLNIDEIDELVNELKLLQKNMGRLFFLGVGGSAANCSHAVNDFRKLVGMNLTRRPIMPLG